VKGKGLFKDAGVVPIRHDVCKNCNNPSDDLFKCNEKTIHLKCTNCKQLFPERNQFDQQCYACD